MMVTKYIIQTKMDTRPDLDYFYAGQNREGAPVYELKKSLAKRYNSWEEADRDARILAARYKAFGDVYTVSTVRCRT